MKREKTGRKEFLIRKNNETGKNDVIPVVSGTFDGLRARVVSLSSINDKLNYGGFEQIYDLRKKVYNVKNLTKEITGENLITFRPPHDQNLKITLANAHEADPYLRRQTGFYTNYVFGDEVKPLLAPLQNETPKTRQENNDLVDKIIGKKKREEFMRYITQVNYMSGIHSHMQDIWNQSYVFGIAAAWKTVSLIELINANPKAPVRIPVGTPVKIKPIDGYYLTNIHQDVDNFEPKYYEYVNPNVTLDEVRNAKGEDIIELSYRANTKLRGYSVFLPWDRLIIVKRRNIGTTPNTSCYGISPILSSLYISENIRRIDEKIFPQINEGMYAGVGIFTVPEESKYDIDQLAADLAQAGTRIVLNEEVNYIPIPVDFKMDQMINQKLHLIKSEIMALGMPESMFFPTDTNRSTLEILINIWQNVDLKEERKMLQEVMWNYWYKDLMKIFFPDEELMDLSLTVKLGFKNKSFAGFIDKAAPTLEGFKLGVLTKPEARENFDEDPFSDYEEEEPFAFQLEDKKGEVAAKNRPVGFGAQSGGSKSSNSSSKSSSGTNKTSSSSSSTSSTSSSTPTVKKNTKATQSTTRSRGGGNT